MDIEKASKNWNELGETDPMWAVLTAEDKRGRKWGPDEFFATGREDVAKALQAIREAGVTVNGGRALDFGCGLGRLTQALAEHFQRVEGVDVSPSMIRQAQQYNKHPDKVQYHLNVKTDLSLLPKNQFDFIYSAIALQHIPTKFQFLYLADFMGLLKENGVAYFQTLHAKGVRALIPGWYVEICRSIKYRGKAFIAMNGASPADVETVIKKGSGRLVQRKSEDVASSGGRFVADTYLVVRQGGKR